MTKKVSLNQEKYLEGLKFEIILFNFHNKTKINQNTRIQPSKYQQFNLNLKQSENLMIKIINITL